MRLLIDASAAFNQGAGIGRYARGVIPELLERLSDADITLWYASETSGPAPFAANVLGTTEGSGRITERRSIMSRRVADAVWFRLPVALPVRWTTGRADVTYSPDFTAPPLHRAPVIVTVHDLAWRIAPQWCPAPLRDYLAAVVPQQVQRAAMVAVVSKTTGRDLIDHYGVPERKIVCVPNGVEARFFRAVAGDDVGSPDPRLPDHYLLMVGTIEPRKNHRNLLAALPLLERRLDLPLVLVGRQGWQAGRIVEEIRRLESMGRVIWLDYVDDARLPLLYARARTVIYPSWYEGFGLPIVEALAAGVPVVASDIAAAREVGGSAVIYVEPASPESIADGIERAVAESGDPARAAERQAQAAQWTWAEAGSRLARAIQQLE